MPSELPRLGLLREIGARLGRLFSAADRVLLHLDVSTRSIADVKAAIRLYWSTFCADPDQPVSGLMVWEQLVLGRSVHHGDRLLLIGCGSGRELHALAQRGCEVVGIEPAEETLGLARRVAASFERPVILMHGFAEDLELPGDFDVCWFSYFAYSYVPDRGRRVALLRKLAARLRPGGRIVISCVSSAQPPQSRAVAIGRAAGRLVGNDWQLAEGDVLVRDEPNFRQFHYQHVFTVAELEEECRDAGLTIAARFPPEAFVARASV